MNKETWDNLPETLKTKLTNAAEVIKLAGSNSRSNTATSIERVLSSTFKNYEEEIKTYLSGQVTGKVK